MKKQNVFKVLGMIILAGSVSACTPIAVATGIGAGVGIAAAQEGGIKSAVTDKAIYIKISDLWMKESFVMYRKLSLTVKEGRVLIAGAVPTADMRVGAVRLAWQAQGVQQVINEVSVSKGTGVVTYVTDAWLSGNVKTRLVIDKNVQSINYNIESVNGTVYLLGVAQNRIELDHALEAVRTTKGVKNVISYVRVRGEIPAGVMAPTVNGSMNDDLTPAMRIPMGVTAERLP